MNGVKTETRRRVPRAKIPTNDIIYLSFPSGNGAVVLDVSSEGLGFQAADSLELSESLSLRLLVPGTSEIELTGKVVWLDSTKRRGGLRLNIPEAARAAFSGWRRKYAEQSPDEQSPDERPPDAEDLSYSTSYSTEDRAPTPSRAPATPPRAKPASRAEGPAPSARPNGSAGRIPLPNPLFRRPDPMYGSHRPIFVSEWEPPQDEAHAGRNLLAFVVIVALCVVVAGGSYYLAGKRQMGDWLIHLGQTISGSSPQTTAPPVVSQTANTAPQAAPAAAPLAAPVASSEPANPAGENSNTTAAPTPSPNASQLAAPAAPIAPIASASSASSVTGQQVNTNVPAANLNASPVIGSGLASVAPVTRSQAVSRTTRETSGVRSSAANSEQGEADLAQAERYLAGSNPQDSATAVEFLWSAIGQGNTQAELVLGDLYLRGRGAVRQNCRQAEVLLRAALVADVPGAVSKVQQLQTYGCR